MKIDEWNINKRSSNISSPIFVSERLLAEQADIICLVEYTDDFGIESKLSDAYWITKSIPLSGNQILIAVNKTIFDEKPAIIRATDEPGCYNFLHITAKIKNHLLSLIGLRMLTGSGKNAIDASKQTPPLNKYLRSIAEPFICIGDFNIREYRMNHWFPQYNTEDVQRGSMRIEEVSYFFPGKEVPDLIGGMGAIDHVLVHQGDKATVQYDWSYMDDDKIYPERSTIKEGSYWNIEPGFPDHAMMIVNWSPFNV